MVVPRLDSASGPALVWGVMTEAEADQITMQRIREYLRRQTSRVPCRASPAVARTFPRLVLQNQEYPFACPDCTASWPSRGSLARHQVQAHEWRKTAA